MSLADLQLPQFSTYSGQAVGRRIDQGALSLQSDWFIIEHQLKASNQLVIDQLGFGESVKSEGALALRLDLAVMLLAGPSGTMDLSLPLTGDLSDPKVSIGQVVRSAVVGLIIDVGAAPFKLLSGLVGSEEDLSGVEFDAGEATLSNAMIKRLNSVATALKARPALKLKIVPQISAADLLALKEGQSGRSAEAELPEQVLSDLAAARSRAVRNHFETSQGIEASRLEVGERGSVKTGMGLRFELR